MSIDRGLEKVETASANERVAHSQKMTTFVTALVTASVMLLVLSFGIGGFVAFTLVSSNDAKTAASAEQAGPKSLDATPDSGVTNETEESESAGAYAIPDVIHGPGTFNAATGVSLVVPKGKAIMMDSPDVAFVGNKECLEQVPIGDQRLLCGGVSILGPNAKDETMDIIDMRPIEDLRLYAVQEHDETVTLNGVVYEYTELMVSYPDAGISGMQSSVYTWYNQETHVRIVYSTSYVPNDVESEFQPLPDWAVEVASSVKVN